MHFGDLTEPLAGVAIPLFSLRTAASAGTGQFPDIVSLARWCASVGIELIQLLPLNDTGSQPSPYSALSAFALNPIYLDLLAIEGSDGIRSEVLAFREAEERSARVDYERVRGFKLRVLRRLFDAARSRPELRPELDRWVAGRPWLLRYAVFAALREETGGRPWWEWTNAPRWDEPEGPAVFAGLGDRALFHVWVQREAELQLAASSRAARELGVRVKGDLPILMSRDSADVWGSPELFDLDHQTGAPPDMFSPNGQNWGFPPYRWDALERQDYRFWRERIGYAGRFYHAVRIDHVLGFLRIWRIASTEQSGVLGHFHPQKLISREELTEVFDEGRLAWLSIPHLRGEEIDAALGAESERVKERLLRRLPGEDLYQLRPETDSERAILALEEPEVVRELLLARHRDRALLEVAPGCFAASWYFAASRAFASLRAEERSWLEDKVRAAYDASEHIWEAGGRRLLAMLRDSTDMLVCAEDLGAVPSCLPPLLRDLGILSLKIERWARDWKAPGQPYLSPAEYPRLSVCTPSVHDTSTLRAYWEEPDFDREAYYGLIGGSGPCPQTLTPQLCRSILVRAMRSASLLAVIQMQDYLALGSSLRVPDPAEERINVPGTVDPRNWSYRLPVSMEELAGDAEQGRLVREVVSERRRPEATGKRGRA